MEKYAGLGQVTISKNVFYKMINQIIDDNKDLFIDKTYLRQKNDKKAVLIHVDERKKKVSIALDINASYAKNINELATTLQTDIKNELEHITEYNVSNVDINVVKITT